jgi:hypothetical protein
VEGPLQRRVLEGAGQLEAALVPGPRLLALPPVVAQVAQPLAADGLPGQVHLVHRQQVTLLVPDPGLVQPPGRPGDPPQPPQRQHLRPLLAQVAGDLQRQGVDVLRLVQPPVLLLHLPGLHQRRRGRGEVALLLLLDRLQHKVEEALQPLLGALRQAGDQGAQPRRVHHPLAHGGVRARARPDLFRVHPGGPDHRVAERQELFGVGDQGERPLHEEVRRHQGT